MLKNTMLYKFHTKLDAVAISNTRYNHDSLINFGGSIISYDILPKNESEIDIQWEQIQSYPLYKIHDSEEITRLADEIIDNLSTNYDNQEL